MTTPDPERKALIERLAASGLSQIHHAQRDQYGECFFPVIVTPPEEKKNPKYGPPYPHRRYS